MTLRGWIVVGLLVIVVALAALATTRLDGAPPLVQVTGRAVVGAEPESLQIELSDEGAGLRTVTVQLEHAGGQVDLASRLFRGSFLAGGAPDSHRATIPVELDPAGMKLADGSATLRVQVRDWSWRGGFGGNLTELAHPLTIDTVPPKLRVDSGLTWVRRGGAGVILYQVDEATTRDGLRVGEAFFRGRPFGEGADAGRGGRRAVVFAIPVEAGASPTLRVVAEDAAGNAASSGVAVRVKDRQFARDEVRLPESFLDRVAVPLAEASGIDASDPVEAFRRINSDLRARNEQTIRGIVSGPATPRRFSGAFEQWPNSAVRSRFAEERKYLVGGVPVSEARHYGYDLAATSRAPVTASNHGTVVFADDLGIYGSCVVVDHGLGVHTLYGHLSEIAVETGASVQRGDVLGRSGATGLAGGDHVHFAVLVGGEYVDPVEWWDPRWIQSHVDSRLGPGPDGNGP